MVFSWSAGNLKTISLFIQAIITKNPEHDPYLDKDQAMCRLVGS